MNKIANMHVASSTAGSLSRRSLFKLGGLATAVAAGASLAGCAPQPKSASMADTGSGATRAADGTPSFLIAPEPITEFDETRDFEVVVVGAGVSGMAAAMSAAEAGAKIACVQREATPSSQGNMAAGVDLNQTSEAGKQALISYLIKLADHRSNRALLEAWADNSFEALSWFREAESAGGIEVNPDEPQADRVLHINGYDVYVHANTYFRIGHDEVVKAITPIAESAGVEFFFSCPAQQLVTDESGRVTGVRAGDDEITAEVVILAEGTFHEDTELSAEKLSEERDRETWRITLTGDLGGEEESPEAYTYRFILPKDWENASLTIKTAQGTEEAGCKKDQSALVFSTAWTDFELTAEKTGAGAKGGWMIPALAGGALLAAAVLVFLFVKKKKRALPEENGDHQKAVQEAEKDSPLK